MENNNEMRINKLPAKTWYWLRMNDTALNWNPDMAGCSVKIDGGKHILKRFRARKNRLAGIVQIFQAVDLCLRDLDLAAVML